MKLIKPLAKAIATLIGLALLGVIGCALIYRFDRGMFGRLMNSEYRKVYGYGNVATVGLLNIDDYNKVVFVDDYSVHSDFCGSDSEFYCVKSPGFHFAVPRDFARAISGWDQAGFHYEIVNPNIYTSTIHGVGDAVIIHSSGKGDIGGSDSINYLYSPRWGLLSFETDNRGSEKRSELVIRGCTGFGGAKSGSLFGYLFQDCWNTTK